MRLRGPLRLGLSMSLIAVLVVTGSADDVTAQVSDGWEAKPLDCALPLSLYRSSLAWTGEKAFIFTGRDLEGPKPTIIEFDPAGCSPVVKEASMPTGRIMSCAAWLEPYAYVFGGQDQTGVLDEIVRYDPLEDSVEVLPVCLPEERMGASAVTVGDSIYVIGGRNDAGHINTVFRFVPGDGTIEEVARLHVTGGGRVSVWDGSRILLLGGCGVNCALDQVLEFDPSTGKSATLNATLPSGVFWTSGVWTGEEVLIFGGNDWMNSVDVIYRYIPAGDGGSVMEVGRLPEPLELSTSFWDGNAAYVLGGSSGLDPSDGILRVSKVRSGGDDDGGESVPFPTGVLATVVASLAVRSFRRRRAL